MNRIIFVTIGQTPRVDVVPEICAWLDREIDVVERGALDGLSSDAIAALAPGSRDRRLVTRLADGTQAVVRADAIHDRLQTVFDSVADDDHSCTVLLCTGEFAPFRTPRLFLDARSIVDHSLAAIAGHARRVGLLVPLEEQMAEITFPAPWRPCVDASYASPYEGDRLDIAARELAGADLIVMHCMGYTEAMRDRVARASGRPVLLARRLVGAALAQLV